MTHGIGRWFLAVLATVLVAGTALTVKAGIAEQERHDRAVENKAFLSATPDYEKQLYSEVVEVNRHTVKSQRIVAFGAIFVILVGAVAFYVAVSHFERRLIGCAPRDGEGNGGRDGRRTFRRRRAVLKRQARIRNALQQLEDAVERSKDPDPLAALDVRERILRILAQLKSHEAGVNGRVISSQRGGVKVGH